MRELGRYKTMATRATTSWEEFLAAGVEGQKSECLDGKVIHYTPVNLRHESIIKRLIRDLMNYCDTHPDWDWYPSNATFTMRSGNWRCPDASLILRNRFPRGELPLQRFEIPPDVAFEIYSPSDNPAEVLRKRKDYLESGVIQVWIDPEKRLIELIYPDRALQYFKEDQPLVIDKLPEFSLDLKKLFSI